MEKTINEHGKEVFTGATEDTSFDPAAFHLVPDSYDDDCQYALHTNLGSLTVLDRMTGFGWRDTETGFSDKSASKLFWLASGGYDVRHSGATTLGEAITWVKEHANNCVGI